MLSFLWHHITGHPQPLRPIFEAKGEPKMEQSDAQRITRDQRTKQKTPKKDHYELDLSMTIAEFVRSIRRDAEASAEVSCPEYRSWFLAFDTLLSLQAEVTVDDPRHCDSCDRKHPEEEFWFGRYRADMCKSCVERITRVQKNKKTDQITVSFKTALCIKYYLEGN